MRLLGLFTMPIVYLSEPCIISPLTITWPLTLQSWLSSALGIEEDTTGQCQEGGDGAVLEGLEDAAVLMVAEAMGQQELVVRQTYQLSSRLGDEAASCGSLSVRDAVLEEVLGGMAMEGAPEGMRPTSETGGTAVEADKLAQKVGYERVMRLIGETRISLSTSILCHFCFAMSNDLSKGTPCVSARVKRCCLLSSCEHDAVKFSLSAVNRYIRARWFF